MVEKSKFLDLDICIDSQSEIVKEICFNTMTMKKVKYFAINPDCILKYIDNQDYRSILREKDNFIYVDGMGIIYAQKFLGFLPAKERAATTDLFPYILNEINKLGKNDFKIYLLGGKGDTAKRVIDKLSTKYTNCNFVGWHNGYFTDEENDKIVKEINDKGTNILFVGFGTPIQEIWVKKNILKLNVPSIITCGGLFDYYSGNVKRAPLFMQKHGLEWLFRLLQEPKRLYKRYIFGNLRFIYLMLKIKLGFFNIRELK